MRPMDNKEIFPQKKCGIRQLFRWEERLIKRLLKMISKNGKSVVKVLLKNSKLKENREAATEMYYKIRCTFYG